MSDVEPPRGTLGTVRNAAVLLGLLSEGAAFQQLSDLAERSGLSLPTVHRLLRSLVAAELVEQDPASSRYGLGPELVRLSERYLERLPLLQHLHPYLVDLRNRSSTTVLVALRVRDSVVYVERIEGADSNLLRRAGRSYPLASTAAGRVLAGRGGAELWKQLAGDGGSASLADLQRWAAADHLVGQVEGPRDHVELAVPVVRADGSASAALAATGGPPAWSAERLRAEVLPELQQAAELAARMSGSG